MYSKPRHWIGKGIALKKNRSRRYPAEGIKDTDYVDDLSLLANTPDNARSLLHSLGQAAAGIALHVKANKTEYICFKRGAISTQSGKPLKLVDKFTYLGSYISSMENNVSIRLAKAWNAIDKFSIIWKSDVSDWILRDFPMYRHTTWTLTKCTGKNNWCTATWLPSYKLSK